MIWWIWTAFRPCKVHRFDVDAAWRVPWEDDVSWLGEGAWTNRIDNLRLGLRG